MDLRGLRLRPLSETLETAGASLGGELFQSIGGAGLAGRRIVGDVNGDGKADIIIFAPSEGKVYVSLAP